ncbi:MAG: phosphatidylglycerophosphatase A [bacterium]|jgi:phosphatidylglycerophosphatase A|nr:phosphatidylglycerophosphatase A [bacterium]
MSQPPVEPPFLTRLIATGFFSGYSVIAPGTAGSAVALILYCLLPDLGFWQWTALLLITTLVAVYTSGQGEKAWGKDPGYVVIDEVVGFFVTVCFLPQSVLLGIAAFFLFRVLDIIKPAPARQAEDLPGGWGIVMDDVFAGIYGNLILRGIAFIWPTSGLL